MFLRLLQVGVLCWCGVQGAQAEPPALLFPPLTGSVVDAAQLLDSSETIRVSQMLRAHEQATGEQIVVVTLVDLQGTTIEDYGTRLGSTWDVGQKGKHNGTLLIVSRDNRKVHIEVGTGLKDRLTEAQRNLIIDLLITPQFRDGRFDVGIERGAQAIVMALGGHVPDDGDSSADDTYVEQAASGEAWPTLLALVLAVLLVAGLGMRGPLRGCRPGMRRPQASVQQPAHGEGSRFGGGGASGGW